MRASVYHNIACDEHGRLINFDGYRPGQPLVHVLEADIGSASGQTSTELAERIWVACNVPPDELGGRLRTIATAYRHRGLRSLSTGDAVILTGDKARVALSVARAGWSLIPGELTIVTTSQHGTVPWLADRWPAAVWMLHRWDRHDDETTPHPAEEDALRQLAGHARSSWAAIARQPGVPAAPPSTDQDAVDLYYGPDGSEGGPCGDEEGYSLRPVQLACPPPAVPPLIAAAHSHLAIDLTSADGRAIYHLFRRIKGIEHPDSSWPGADVIEALKDWLASCGLDVQAAAPDLP
jgi:hypothetical protein